MTYARIKSLQKAKFPLTVSPHAPREEEDQWYYTFTVLVGGAEPLRYELLEFTFNRMFIVSQAPRPEGTERGTVERQVTTISARDTEKVVLQHLYHWYPRNIRKITIPTQLMKEIKNNVQVA